MFKTKTLGSLKSLFPPIHQPLPLTNTESQRLLNALTTSFRKRLDEEHGFAEDLSSRPAVTYLPSDAEPVPPKPVHGRPTDQHLRSILSNPLFKENDTRTKSPTMEPNEVFERAVAKGLMTIPRAHGFLKTVEARIRESCALSVDEAMRDSAAGRLVVQWLRASGHEQKLDFLENRPFRAVLLQFMVAEGLDELALEWFQRLISRDAASSGLDPTYASRLLKDLAMTKSKILGSESGFATVNVAESQVQKNWRPLGLLSSTWMNVTRGTTIYGMGLHTPASVPTFEQFADLGDRLPASNTLPAFLGSAALERAHLDLYHPTTPSSERALSFLIHDGNWKVKTRDPSTIPSSGLDRDQRNYVRRLDYLIVDTAKYLLRVGEFEASKPLFEQISRIRDKVAVGVPAESAVFLHNLLSLGRNDDPAADLLGVH